MAITQNTYTGNGSTVLYSFAFPYLDTADVKVSLNGTITTAYTFANATTIQFNTAPANGAAIRIYRETDDTTLQAVFSPGSSIRASDLNDNFDQLIYLGQESNNEANSATTTANTALTNSATAISTANTASTNASNAVSTANTASANASAAVSTANTASTNASNAVSTANTASTNATTALNTANSATTTANNATSTANTALSTANTALTNANAAVSTANTASTNANNAVSTANTASTNATNAVNTANTASTNATTAVNTANSAVTTANAAAAAVANAVLYTTVANVAAIPGSPSNNTAIEVTNSTGIESFTPLSGLPAGFVGSSGLSVRIIYQTAGATWTWIQYFPNDPETRYFKLSGGTITGPITVPQGTVSSPGVKFSGTGNDNTGVYSPGIDELGLVTNGVNRLAIDSAGAVSIPGTLGVTGAVTGTSTVSGSALIPTGSSVPTNGVYLPAANTVGISTGGSGRLFINSSGKIGVNTSAPSSQFSVGSDTNAPSVISLDYNPTNTTAASISANHSTGEVRYGAVAAYFPTFYSNNLERLRITSAGLVGIGSSSPDGTLHVQGTNSGGTLEALVLRNNATAAGTQTAIRFTNSTGAFNHASIVGTRSGTGALDFYTAGSATAAMSIDSSSRVGIGTTSAGGKLHVSSGSSSALVSADADELIVENSGNSGITIATPNSGTGSIRFADPQNNDSGSISYNHNDETLRFATFSTERARFDSSGRLLVGTSSATGANNVSNSRLQISGNNAGGSGYLALVRSVTATNTDELGRISFADGVGEFASISAIADATTGTNDYPGRLVFSTTADGAASPTERMRIRQNGNIGIGVTGYDVVRLAVNGQSTTSSDYALAVYNSSSADLFNVRNDGVFATGTQAGSPYNNTTAVAANMHVNSGGNLYRSTSSARFKTDIETLQDQYADAILNVRPVWYRSLCASDNQEWGYWGFIAEEVAEVDPRLVFWKTHETVRDENGKQTSIELEEPLAESVQYDRFVPHLLNLIKRQGEAIAQLQAEVTALKAQ